MTTTAEPTYLASIDDLEGWRELKQGRARGAVPVAPGEETFPAQNEAGRHRLLFEFALFNLAAFALLVAAYMQGWIGTILAADSTGLTVAIFGVFLGGLALAAGKLRSISCELDGVRYFDPCKRSLAIRYLSEIVGRSSGSRAITASALRVKLVERTAIVRHLANSLVLLGLIGTVVGFIIALSGVDPEQASDVRSVAPMVSELIRGMSVALYTTLVGSVLNLWLMVNYRLLASGTVQLATELIALGEHNARPGVV
jgi:MotA/TolQ/ExbB proton channel family